MIDITNKEECCGCGACKNICPNDAIKMNVDNQGFLYPTVDKNKCIKCDECNKVCLLTKEIEKSMDLPQVYAVRHKDDNVLSKSTSGGAFTALSDVILDEAGFVVGCEYDYDDHSLNYKLANDRIELEAFRGVKYFQSNMNEVVKEVGKHLENERSVLFTGTPCHVSSVRSYCNNRKIDTTNLYLCDMICHGVPSPEVWKDYISLIEKSKAIKINQVSFRDKKYGWDHTTPLVRSFNKEFYIDDFMSLYATLCILRPSCHVCPYTDIHRVSDITIADFWGIQHVLPDFFNAKGNSLVLVNSEKGRVLFRKIEKDINYVETTIESCMQPNLEKPTEKPIIREQFWKDYEINGIEYILKKYVNTSKIDYIRRGISRLIKINR